MTKNSTQSFWHWVSDMRISSWLYVSPRSFTDRYSSCGWWSRSTSSWFCFSLWSARKSKYICLQRKFFELHLRGLLLVVVVLFVAQVRDLLIQSMRNSDPRVRIVFVYKFNSNFHSIFTLQVAGCDFQHGPQFWCSLESNLLGQMIFHFLAKCTHDMSIGSVDCENSSVSFVMKYCPTSAVVRRILHQYKKLLTLSCCDNFSIRSWYLSNRSSSCAGSSVKSMCVFITLDTNIGSDCPTKTGLTVIAWQILCSSHKSETAPWILGSLTEMVIVRKTVSIVIQSAQKCIDNCPPPLLWSVPRDTGLVARKTGCPLSPNFIIIHSATLSHSPCGLLPWVEYHFFFWSGSEEWHLLGGNLLA